MRIKRTFLLVLILVALLVLVACGGEDEKPSAPKASPQPQQTDSEIVTPAPPGPGNTPMVLPSDATFQQAVDLAKPALAARLNISLTQITTLPADTAIWLQSQLTCSELEDPGVNIYSLYLEYEQMIYPYQYYTPEGGEMTLNECEALVSSDARFTPTPDSRYSIVDTVKQDLSQRTGLALDQLGDPTKVESWTWYDTALGCGTSPTEATSVIIEGFLVVYDVQGTTYEYHTDSSGSRVEYCAPPQGAGSAEELIAAIASAETSLEIVRSEDPARYEGLDQDGIRVLFGPYEWAVGFFDFPSPDAARAAAAQITDPVVSFIFVSGNVLIVQEEFASRVYSLLAQRAVEVRSPMTEGSAATQEASE